MPRTAYRSAVTGRWVTRAYAVAHPSETVAETVGPARALWLRLTRRA